MDELFERLGRSSFRSRFRLNGKDRAYLAAKGNETIRAHAVDFITARLAPAHIPNDGRQTPMRNHPVFVAQHATGTCCRKCLEKWHGIPKGIALNAEQIDAIVDIVMTWIDRERNTPEEQG